MTSNPRKIAVVIPKYGLVGGAEGFAAELTERIAQDRRFEVHVFANKWQKTSGHIAFHGVPVITFPKFLTTVSFAYFAGYKISKMNFDLIHTHDRIFDADIFTMHGIPHRIWVREVRKKRMSLFDYATAWAEKKLVTNKRCRRFLAVSNLAKEKFLQEYKNVNPDKVQVIHPGVDIQRFQGLDRQLCRQEIRRHFGIDFTEMVILFVSMNFDIKGLDKLMMGLAKFKSKYPSEKFRLLVVGKGDADKYGRLAQNLGIKDHVIFTGVVQKENLDRIYLACDIFSMLSKFDTFGMSVLEAMSASLPVIISGNVGATDLVKEGVNGFVVENTSESNEISHKITWLFNADKRTSMAKEAYNTALSNSWKVVTEKIISTYEELSN
ncbi:MAG: glycosyltransferase family 1 protein [Deltaproteobacteria bacterium]|nr:MAG: glycosyltransferase family 1 protein [Deltaproteobacteria bacterium]